AGAKNGIVEPDEITRAYVDGRSQREGIFLTSDPDAGYERMVHVDVAQIEPQVALPHSPDNVRPVSEIGVVKVDQVFIGSCTNGRMEDLREAVKVLSGHTVARDTRLIVIPGSPYVYKTAIDEGIIQTMLDVGAVIGPPCCGPCLGGHMGILAEGEKAISTSNRNFIGRMGHANSEVYLANPAIAAASAVLGRIGAPEEI
ncbi:MAG: 3-isopropylmalate dehydratase large subunit, partial [Deltaproteobacteria bacterium]|nr:3-isopropylmalate dehydratase large subunit [Deltaproteobacteria bacterium]